MRRVAALLWLLVVAGALAYVGQRSHSGAVLQTDLLDLLPHAEADPVARLAKTRITDTLFRRIVLLVGHEDARIARQAGRSLALALERSGLVAVVTSTPDPEAQGRIGAAYFPHRRSLLARADRATLLAGRGEAIVARALAAVHAPGGAVDGQLLAEDPFLLAPAYFAGLPTPWAKLSAGDGVLTVRDGPTTYAFVAATLKDDAFSLAFQEAFTAFLDDELAKLAERAPGLVALRAGALFYAAEGANAARGEIAAIGLASLVGVVSMIVLVFRGVRPIALSLLSVGLGVACAVAATLLVFGELHVVALLFGVSLIGVSVDYSLAYFCEHFGEASASQERLARVLPGIGLGVATTVVGYLALLLAPFPGLRQMAIFSAVGLTAAFLTVALWYPALDRGRALGRNGAPLALATAWWRFCDSTRWRALHRVLLVALLTLAAIGALRLRADHDVRHMQALSPALQAQERKVQQLVGVAAGAQFFLVKGAGEQQVLEREEALLDLLALARQKGVVAEVLAPAQFAPSIARQKENRNLVRGRLAEPHLAAYLAQLGFSGRAQAAEPPSYLTWSALPKDGPLKAIESLVIDEGGVLAHLVLVNGATDSNALRALAREVEGVQLLSPADDISHLFAAYSRAAVAFLALSAGLMLSMLALRYGWRGALRVLAPPLAGAVLAPPLAALIGVHFTFFNAVALILVLAIGVDYAIFCRESPRERKPVTVLAISLAALSTLLSFGLLSMSQVFAVHAFGTTLLIGVTIAYLLAPSAAPAGDRT